MVIVIKSNATQNITLLKGQSYEGRSICNVPDPVPIGVEQRNLAQLLVFLYIGTTQSYAFLPSFDTALETVFVEHPKLVLQP